MRSVRLEACKLFGGAEAFSTSTRPRKLRPHSSHKKDARFPLKLYGLVAVARGDGEAFGEAEAAGDALVDGDALVAGDALAPGDALAAGEGLAPGEAAAAGVAPSGVTRPATSYLPPSAILIITMGLTALRSLLIVTTPVTPGKFLVCASASRMAGPSVEPARLMASNSMRAAS
jgi:hypothetical protein